MRERAPGPDPKLLKSFLATRPEWIEDTCLEASGEAACLECPKEVVWACTRYYMSFAEVNEQ